ncbi:MAG: ComEC/Rec2 family competence protein [bacterium]
MISRKEIYILIFLALVALVRFFFFVPKSLPYTSAVGKMVSVEGQVVSAPDTRLNNTRFTIRPTDQDSNILAVVLNNNLKENISYGDKVKVMGLLDTPKNFTTSSGKEFNYERYLANQDIYFIVSNADISVLSTNGGLFFVRNLYRLRNAFMDNIGRSLYPPESDLADGLVLGARGGFDSSMRDKFIATGTIHIVALSGYNVTIVAKGVMSVLGLFLSQTLSISFGILVIILFIIMSGSSSTAIRAGIMAIIALTGQMTGRTYSAGRALVIAGLLMVAWDPRVLTDISFQLSFIATFGVLYITPKVIHWVRFIPYRFGLRELVATTLGATISVLPILLYSTGILSLVSLPANILILPLMPFTMLMIFITGMFGFISITLALPFAFITHLILHYMLYVISFFASLSFASVTIQSFPLTLTIIFYILMLRWVFKKKA